MQSHIFSIEPWFYYKRWLLPHFSQGSEKFSDLPKFTQIVNDRLGIWITVSSKLCIPVLSFFWITQRVRWKDIRWFLSTPHRTQACSDAAQVSSFPTPSSCLLHTASKNLQLRPYSQLVLKLNMKSCGVTDETMEVLACILCHHLQLLIKPNNKRADCSFSPKQVAVWSLVIAFVSVLSQGFSPCSMWVSACPRWCVHSAPLP